MCKEPGVKKKIYKKMNEEMQIKTIRYFYLLHCQRLTTLIPYSIGSGVLVKVLLNHSCLEIGNDYIIFFNAHIL